MYFIVVFMDSPAIDPTILDNSVIDVLIEGENCLPRLQSLVSNIRNGMWGFHSRLNRLSLSS